MPNVSGIREKRYVRITKCSNPALHYSAYSDTIGEVVFETRSAVWLKHPTNKNFWVYKRDVIFLDYITSKDRDVLI